MSIALLSVLLMLPSQQVATKAELEAEVDRLHAKRWVEKVPDRVFVVQPMDWSKLTTQVVDPAFTDAMRQALAHGCMLNATRFVLQMKHDVMIGQALPLGDPATRFVDNGDRAVYALSLKRWIGEGHTFESQYLSHYPNRDLRAAAVILQTTGVATGEPELTLSLTHYINLVRGHGGRGALLVSGVSSGGADHAFVLYDFKDIGGNLHAKVYDPWTGLLLADPTSPGTDWMDVETFSTLHAMPVEAVDSQLYLLDAAGNYELDADGDRIDLIPGMPVHPSQTVQYAVLFAPL